MKHVLTPCRAALVVLILGRAFAAGQPASDKLPTGFRGEFLSQLADVEKKCIDLATAVPAEKFSWRPGEGVRSVGEVYVHIGASNYFLPSMIGIKAPPGLKRDMETTLTDKPRIIELLQKSFAHLRSAVMEMNDRELGKPAKFFGRETTVEGVLFAIANHMHEHLGQSIAYARTNGVVPPWTAEQQEKAKEKK